MALRENRCSPGKPGTPVILLASAYSTSSGCPVEQVLLSFPPKYTPCRLHLTVHPGASSCLGGLSNVTPGRPRRSQTHSCPENSCSWSAIHASWHGHDLPYLARPLLQTHVSTELLASSIPATVAFWVSLQRPDVFPTVATTVDSAMECSFPRTLRGSLFHFTCAFTQLPPPQSGLP